MALTDIAIKSSKPRESAFKLSDGRGLQLHVTPQGSRLWRWAYRHEGKQKLMALGVYPDVSLAQARDKAELARKLLATGVDPMAARKSDKIARRLAVEDTFAAVAKKWWESWKAARSDSHTVYVWRRLEADVFPAIGKRPVAEIEAPELVAMMKAIEKRGALDIAKRALQTCSQIFRYAIAHGLAKRNPAVEIRPSDVLASRKKENYARLDSKELPELLRKIEVYNGSTVTRVAIKLMAMTFVRTSELIGARWEEFDLDGGRWDIPRVPHEDEDASRGSPLHPGRDPAAKPVHPDRSQPPALPRRARPSEVHEQQHHPGRAGPHGLRGAHDRPWLSWHCLDPAARTGLAARAH